jgi:outer membrane protein TolC
MKVVVCSPCGSMITFRAADEAERVRRDLMLELAQAYMRIDGLDERLHRLEQSVVAVRNKG